jgi:hypothetical protein
MELKSFREILLKKADGNPYLQTLIKYAKDDLIAEEVVEALLKMAEPSAAMGRGANHAITSYAAGMKPVHVEQLRDALGHHISHYQGALKAHHAATDPKEKAKLRGIADQHLNKIVPLMHLAGRASKHSGGNLTLDYPSMTPWETNYTGTERHAHNGKLKEGTKDLGRRPAPNANRERNPRAVPDYRYLEMPPHPGHTAVEKMPHKGGYPFEEVQLGSPMKRDAGQAYLPIEDVGEVKEYVPHPFDAHPVHQHADVPQHELGPEHHEAINAGLSGWADSEHHKKWLADQKAKHAADPEAYKARGTKKPGHVYEGIPLTEMPHHKAVPAAAPAEAPAPKAEAPKQAEVAAPAPKAQASKPTMDLSKPPEGSPMDDKIWSQIPDDLKAAIHEHAAKGKKK